MSRILTNHNSSKEYNIITTKTNLSLCKIKIKKLQSLNTNDLSSIEKSKIQYTLNTEFKRHEILKNKLKKLGYTDRRGRPKKCITEKYSNTHKKFTAMLLPENITYLKSLKTEKKIKNISEFLDELIIAYRENSIS